MKKPELFRPLLLDENAVVVLLPKEMGFSTARGRFTVLKWAAGIGVVGAMLLLPLLAVAQNVNGTGVASIPTAPKAAPSSSEAATAATGVSEAASKSSESSARKGSGLSRYIGLNYFTFFDGPGLSGEFSKSPTEQGIPGDIGWTLWTNLSIRGKITERFAIDYQARLEQVVTNNIQFRNQGGRLGISGTLLKGERWTLNGAFNSDIPGVGAIPVGRTLVLNPGLFSTFSYSPRASRWSVFALVSPRYFIYRDRDAMADQDIGLTPGMKPEIVIALNPSLNYALNDRQGFRAGVTLDYRKNSNQASIGRWFAPIDVGYTHEFSKAFSIYPHLRVSGPWDNGIRNEIANRRGVSPQSWTDTLSLGMWISGTIL